VGRQEVQTEELELKYKIPLERMEDTMLHPSSATRSCARGPLKELMRMTMFGDN
jgi:hypothetical protein